MIRWSHSAGNRPVYVVPWHALDILCKRRILPIGSGDTEQNSEEKGTNEPLQGLPHLHTCWSGMADVHWQFEACGKKKHDSMRIFKILTVCVGIFISKKDVLHK